MLRDSERVKKFCYSFLECYKLEVFGVNKRVVAGVRKFPLVVAMLRVCVRCEYFFFPPIADKKIRTQLDNLGGDTQFVPSDFAETQRPPEHDYSERYEEEESQTPPPPNAEDDEEYSPDPSEETEAVSSSYAPKELRPRTNRKTTN